MFEFENTRSNVESVAITEKKENKISDKSYIPTRHIYLQKLPQLLILQMNHSFRIMFKSQKKFLQMITYK